MKLKVSQRRPESASTSSGVIRVDMRGVRSRAQLTWVTKAASARSPTSAGRAPVRLVRIMCSSCRSPRRGPTRPPPSGPSHFDRHGERPPARPPIGSTTFRSMPWSSGASGIGSAPMFQAGVRFSLAISTTSRSPPIMRSVAKRWLARSDPEALCGNALDGCWERHCSARWGAATGEPDPPDDNDGARLASQFERLADSVGGAGYPPPPRHSGTPPRSCA